MAEERDDQQAFSIWRDALGRLLRNRMAVVSLALLAFVVFMAIFGRSIAPYDYRAQDLRARYAPISQEHWLGTDELGRDVLSRVIYGSRTALMVSGLVVVCASIIGITIGSISGYVGGRLDTVLMWITDLVMSFPFLILGVVLTVSLRPPISRWMESMFLATKNPIYRQSSLLDLAIVVVVITLTSWPLYARLLRSQVMNIRHRNYVVAARALGVPTRMIIAKYIIPNAIGPVIVAMSAGLGSAMLSESAYSYLGIGIQLPVPSWGNMIGEGIRVWLHHPHQLFAPALVLGLTTAAFSFLGDGLNDALNPRQWKGK